MLRKRRLNTVLPADLKLPSVPKQGELFDEAGTQVVLTDQVIAIAIRFDRVSYSIPFHLI